MTSDPPLLVCNAANCYTIEKLAGHCKEIQQVEIRQRRSSWIDRASALLSRNAVIGSYLDKTQMSPVPALDGAATLHRGRHLGKELASQPACCNAQVGSPGPQ
jgi:hypothetical protein